MIFHPIFKLKIIKKKNDSEILENKPRRQFNFNLNTIGVASLIGLLIVAWIVAYVFL